MTRLSHFLEINLLYQEPCLGISCIYLNCFSTITSAICNTFTDFEKYKANCWSITGEFSSTDKNFIFESSSFDLAAKSVVHIICGKKPFDYRQLVVISGQWSELKSLPSVICNTSQDTQWYNKIQSTSNFRRLSFSICELVIVACDGFVKLLSLEIR